LGRVIGIDLGLKRTGIAVTDPDQMIATPVEVVETNHLLDYLKQYTIKEDVEGFVLGDPVKPDGSPTHTTEAVKKLHAKLSETFPEKKVILIDERYTTSLALDAMLSGGTTKKYRKEKGNLDKISATIILQSYLEQKSFGKH
jgi:putative Holliday junction resolvase